MNFGCSALLLFCLPLSAQQSLVFASDQADTILHGGVPEARIGWGYGTNSPACSRDFNGDGIADLLVAFRSANNNPCGLGPLQVWIFFGGPSLIAQPLITPASAADVTLQGLPDSGCDWGDLGLASGDFNGDGLADVLIGLESPSLCYVIYGRPSWPSTLSLPADADVVVQIPGSRTVRYLGCADANHDGFDDLLVAGWDQNPAHVVFGSNLPHGASVQADSSNCLVLQGGAGTGFVTAGDLNGDGIEDLVCRDNTGFGGTGTIAVLLGPVGPGSINPYQNASFLVRSPAQPSCAFSWGFGFALVADFNGDGIGDLVMSDPTESVTGGCNQGIMWLIHGRTSWPPVWDLATQPADRSWYGVESEGSFGVSIATGDHDRDGRQDLLIGAYTQTVAGMANAGRVFLLLGQPAPATPQGPVPMDISLSALTIEGTSPSDALSAGFLLDITGDGIDDIVAGASGASISGGPSREGCYYIFDGREPGRTDPCAGSQFTITDTFSGLEGSSPDPLLWQTDADCDMTGSRWEIRGGRLELSSTFGTRCIPTGWVGTGVYTKRQFTSFDFHVTYQGTTGAGWGYAHMGVYDGGALPVAGLPANATDLDYGLAQFNFGPEGHGYSFQWGRNPGEAIGAPSWAILRAGDVFRLRGKVGEYLEFYHNGVLLHSQVPWTPPADALVAGVYQRPGGTLGEHRTTWFDDFQGSFGTPNLAPSAQAGPDQTVGEGQLVRLDGGSSYDPEGQGLSYRWTQLAGPPVALDLTDPRHPVFVAPAVPVGGATLTFELVVNDGCQDSDADIVNVTVKNVNNAPVAIAEAPSPVRELAFVTLDGSKSYDPDDEALSFYWTELPVQTVVLSDPTSPTPFFQAPPVGPGGLTLTFQLVVYDGIDFGSDTVQVLVENVNQRPVADAGEDLTRDEGTLVRLDGSASSDPDGDVLSFQWSQVSGTPVSLDDAQRVDPVFTAPLTGPGGETLVFELVVSDGQLQSDPSRVSVVVRNVNDPPSCTQARPSQAILWPPNHKMVPITIEGLVDPDDDQLSITVLGVTQDEPVLGTGSGDTSPDAIVDGPTVLLRAERAGNGNGRVYTIRFQATDEFQQSCIGSVTVAVPHSRGNSTQAIDDGQLHDSLQR